MPTSSKSAAASTTRATSWSPSTHKRSNDAAHRAKQEGFGAIAVAFLFAYLNPDHELQAEAILKEELTDTTSISLSHRIAREWREYERTSSTVVDAYTSPVVRRYLDRLEDRLKDAGVSVPLHVMQSSGGIVTAQTARQASLQTLLSGPVGGTLGGVALARLLGRQNLICIDMGGTSFDVSLVVDGQPDVSTEASLEGFPLLMPVVNIHTIGAGGGSIAYAEAGGLRVGPESAGADPGPACYGLGGTQPTVTDANLVLGRVEPDSFAGGRMTLDVDAAHDAVTALANELNLETEVMAEGICDVINAKMAQAIRTLTVEKGIEPRDFALVAFGGAGPMHAPFLAQELDVGEVLVPRFPGAFSAWGMLEAEIRQDFARAYYTPLADLDAQDLTNALEEQEREALAALAEEGVPNDSARVEHQLDVRYIGQEYTLTIPLTQANEPATDDFNTAISGRFDEAHDTRFGHANPGAPIEFVAARSTGLGDLTRAAAERLTKTTDTTDANTNHPRDRVRPHRARRPSPATRRPASGLNTKRPGRDHRGHSHDGRAAGVHGANRRLRDDRDRDRRGGIDPDGGSNDRSDHHRDHPQRVHGGR